MVRARETFGSWSLGFGKLSSQEDDPTLLELKRSGKVEQRLRRSNPEAPNAIDGYEHDSFTFSSDGQTVISGGDNGRLIAYDLTGKRLGDYDGHDGEVWAVAASDDGRLIVSGSVDKTIRLWNAGTRELLVTLFDGPNGEWVAWTPQGYYASSPGGDRYVGWQVNHGPEHAPDFYTVRQLKEKLYRPDIVSRALALRSANEAVKEARLLDPGSMQFDLGTLAARKLPKVTVLYPPSWDKVAAAKVEIALDLDDTADPVTQIDVSINGSRVEPQNASPTEVGGRMRKIIVPIKRDLNRITIRATNAMGWAENQNPLVIFGTEKGELDKKGDLYIVAIGVNDYPDLATDLCPGQICQLNYSVADAKDFAAQVVKASGLQSAGKSPMYNNVKTKMLISGAGGDSEPTAANVRDAFDMLHGAKDNDTVVVFLAGHGMNEEIKGRQWYRFLPTDARRADSGFLRTTTVISWTELAENLGNARGARLLFVDTCHAAGASGSFSQDIAKSPYDKGVVVFSAVNQEKTSQERKDLGHGVFTMALLLGLRGEAAVDGEVWLLGFADFVSRLVKKMTSDAQVPEIKADGTANYVIARPQ
jgi:WD40 repeat protein